MVWSIIVCVQIANMKTELITFPLQEEFSYIDSQTLFAAGK
jgi:hypothetical protein